MLNYNKPLRGIDWSAIFKKRPSLNPPGYNQLLEQIRQEKSNGKDV